MKKWTKVFGMYGKRLALGMVWLAGGIGPAVHAQVAHEDAIRTGYYTSDGWLDAHSYLTGIPSAFGAETRGMVAFDLTGIAPGTVTAAALTLQNPYTVNEVGNADLELRLYGLTTMDTSNMGIPGTFSSIHIGNFNYIGSNLTPFYGSVMVPVHPNGLPNTTPVVFNLTGQALTDLQNALGNDSFFAFGMKIVKADAEEPKPLQYVFGGTAPGGVVGLDLTITPVPEPSALGLWGLIALGAQWALRKHARQPAKARSLKPQFEGHGLFTPGLTTEEPAGCPVSQAHRGESSWT